MHYSLKREFPQARSYSSIIQHDYVKDSEFKKFSPKTIENFSIYQALTKDVSRKITATTNNSELLNETSYVTSERYHSLNKKSSDKSVIRSTSTFFYDLDSLAKRHSYHCANDISESKHMIIPKHSGVVINGFRAKSEAIVQECATQMKPKILTVKNTKENKKKVKSDYHDKLLQLSSEIFLRDNEVASYKSQPNSSFANDRHQKFWSFAKYRTEYTNPVDEEKKLKKKDRGKRTEDPCPCQLFSYACPCTNNKSLTKLAKNSKSLTVADQVTSTHQIFVDEQKSKKRNKNKKIKELLLFEDKITSTIDIIEKTSQNILSKELYTRNMNNNVSQIKSNDTAANAMKMKLSRTPRKVICPNCNEMVDVLSSTEEEQSLKTKTSPLYRSNELSATATYTYQDVKDNKRKVVDSKDICNHEPQCELVPVCQILPTDNGCVGQNMTNKQSPVKTNPRVIRITKGCRHHPPCTVVPSCQRMNVLNNNCEYIPPCLHRPRCVNLPLCAPHSKTIYYEESANKPAQDFNIVENLDTTECHHLHENKYIKTNQFEFPENHNRVQNTCEYLSECSPRFVRSPTLGCRSPMPSPCQIFPSNKYCKSEKSCQFDLLYCKYSCTDQKKESEDDVIFIRDVGCQFRNKNYSPKDSLVRSKTSSGSFNYFNENIDKYCGDFHTLRYEDKFTIPISGEEISISTGTLSSTEIDSQCPTHGRHKNQDSQRAQTTGFVPNSNISPFIGYTHIDPNVNFCLPANGKLKKKLEIYSKTLNISTEKSRSQQNVFSLKSRKSFLKGKYKAMIPTRRRRTSRTSYLSNY